MKLLKDQLGKHHAFEITPKRIISLVPSQTELLYDLGLEEKVVGITKFCVHPDHWLKSKTIIGGTKNFRLDAIEKLKPDLIIGNKEENYQEGISALQQIFPVWMSDVTTFDDALSMIHSVSLLTGSETEGKEIIEQIKKSFEKMKALPKIKTLYLMWENPWMGAASKTFIHTMMEKIGLTNVLDKQERYPELSASIIKELNPPLVIGFVKSRLILLQNKLEKK